MITTVTNLTMGEALQVIKGTKNTMYRQQWMDMLAKDSHVALISVGEEEDQLFFVANDELYSPTLSDMVANDWCILVDETVEGEDEEENDNLYFDELIGEMAHIMLELKQTSVNYSRFAFFKELLDLFVSYYGAEEFINFLKTGDMLHSDKCECISCLEDKIDVAMEGISNVVLQAMAEGTSMADLQEALNYALSTFETNK